MLRISIVRKLSGPNGSDVTVVQLQLAQPRPARDLAGQRGKAAVFQAN
jgi:hypothetical protein